MQTRRDANAMANAIGYACAQLPARRGACAGRSARDTGPCARYADGGRWRARAREKTTATVDQPGSFRVLLQGHRLAAQLSQAEVALRGGVSRRRLSPLAPGARPPPAPAPP